MTGVRSYFASLTFRGSPESVYNLLGGFGGFSLKGTELMPTMLNQSQK